MQEIKGNTIAFKEDGTLVIFDSREEFGENVHKLGEHYEVWASPLYLLRALRENEATIEEYEQRDTHATLDDLSFLNGLRRGSEKEAADSEVYMRAKTARNEKGQNKLWEAPH